MIAAVIAGTEHDETGWLELKSTLDLSTKGAQFAVARAVLGMSNRDPEAAAQWCEGTAYVIVGADHDGCHGITTVDFAVLENGLAPYLGTGADAPRWSPRYVAVGDKTVLVVTIEASQYGDRIKPLRKESDTARAGAIFVRGQAKTETATPGEIAMLEDRRARGQQVPAIGLTVVGSVASPGLAWVEDYSNTVTVAEWLSKERREVTAGAPVTPRKTGTTLDQFLTGPGVLGGPLDRRPAFEREVHDYLQTCRTLLPAVVRGAACRTAANKLRVTAINPEDTTMDAVRVMVKIDAEAADVFDLPPPNSRLPRRPKYNDSPFSILAAPTKVPRAADLHLASQAPGAVVVERAGPVWRAVWSMGDLHPEQEMRGDGVTVIPHQGVDLVKINWSATARNRRGVVTGSQSFSVLTDRWIVVTNGSAIAHE
ncbi:hypothetical protein [uncultured Jatrophihabitans sp.]|uniref:hypothetical protein n=1 Tax=uncultured Jatrophihabitans sp. TaxID=1610747 RepID=UPI0035CBC032